LTIELTKSPKAHQAKETLKFGATMSDHMLEVDWTAENGWTAPRIIPYQPLKLDPAASSLHYGLEVSTDGRRMGRRTPRYQTRIRMLILFAFLLSLTVLRGHEGLRG
jgi:hypothetical protein